MRQPYPFQLENIEEGSKRHVLIADDCGLGKTLSAVEIGKCTRKFPDLNLPWRALVICPKGVRLQWVKEIATQDPDVNINVIELHEEVGTESRGWHIIHYEALVISPPLSVMWDFVVVDEAHRIRNRKTQRSQMIKRLSSLRRVALSGTPMDKDPSEMWSIWNWLYPGEFTSYWAFRKMYTEIGYNSAGYPVVVGPLNVRHLANKLGRRFLKHTKEQVARDLPPKIFIYEPLQMDSPQQSLYDSIRKSRDIEVPTDGGKLVIPNALAKIVRLQQAASDPLALGESFLGIPSVKIDWTLEFVDDHPELSLVIFTRFVKTAEHIYKELCAAGELVSTFYGGQARFPQEFLDRQTRILVATIAKGGEGLDLKFVDAAIFVDQEYSTIKMQQAYDRIHRLGVNKPKLIYVLQCSPVDQLIQDAIDKKWDDAKMVYEALERNIL